MSGLRRSLTSLVILGTLVSIGSGVAAQEAASDALTEAMTAWPAEVLDAVARVPVQEGGRLKPLSTMAGFALLRIHHRRTYADLAENKHDPTSWVLNVLLRPEACKTEPMFLVENDEVLDEIGVSHEGHKKRDRYSYLELAPGRAQLSALASSYGRMDPKARTPVQGQVVNLSHAVAEFEGLIGYLEFARKPVVIPDSLRELFEGRGEVPVSELVARSAELLRPSGSDAAETGERRRLLNAATQRLGDADALAILPPEAEGETEWFTPADLARRAAAGRAPHEAHVAVLRALEDAVATAESEAGLGASFERLLLPLRAAAEARGVYEKIELEVAFYRLDPFFKSLVIYLLGFVLVAATWFRPRSKWLVRLDWVVVSAALVLQVYGIVLRCILRGRPPVSTLYETVIFTTAVVVLTCLLVEGINRRRIMLSAAPLLGALGLFVSMRYEAINQADTMPQLIAVLDTNFWLATHVTCITIGYAAGLLAAAVAHVYVIGRLVGAKRDDPGFYRSVARMTYGTICFALVFSVVGTILGGVWANESWGRFWGWDPKENGALLIVLSQLALLHARMGGYIRDHGIAMSAIFGGGIVAFSWWGVNLLGVGLHSYGFTQGVMNGLVAFYAVEAIVLVLGGVCWLRRRTPAAPDDVA